ncbi:MBL fold metallo-hydrolase [Demequina iriomotensis]|uniref:MBL fold metallo-hydrolase n=1 Tax=Demequina iriomotensis TaxID=1536641 RepID=UPI000780AB3A|nr:MBL fold metallo-hydrolase [Demequina iriomotensis]
MRLTKHGHACVSIASPEGRLLIDPGAYTPDAADLIAATGAVLLTHEHPDHVDAKAILAALAARPDLRVVGPDPVVGEWAGRFPGQVSAVAPGEALVAGGLAVTVHGGRHAEIHPDMPRPVNVGYLVGGRVYHPGDSLEAPGEVDVLLVPASGPWFRAAGAVDLVRAVRPARAIAIHDAHASAVGLGVVARVVESLAVVPLEVLAPGESVEL